MAHRSGRVIDRDALLRIFLVLHVMAKSEQGPEDNPDVNAHQSRPAVAIDPRNLEGAPQSLVTTSRFSSSQPTTS
jgi:hypothetical protein